MHDKLRVAVRSVYDLQKLRIQVGNRISASFRAKLGIEPGEKLKDVEDTEAQKILKRVKADYKLLNSGYAELGQEISKRNFKPYGLIESYAEHLLVKDYFALLESETLLFTTIEVMLGDFPIYTEYLKHVHGVGPAMAGIIVSEINIHEARYASSLWAYAGLDLGPDGRGRGRFKEHLVKRTYIDKDGKEKERDSITFNPLLKTKLLGVLGSSFIKQKPEKCKYRVIYDNYKHRLEHSAAWKEKQEKLAADAKANGKKYAPVAHRHNAAVRYMIKMFLIDLWKEWRRMEGLPTPDPYHVAKLGLRDHDAEVIEKSTEAQRHQEKETLA